MINLAQKDISHTFGKFLVTAMGVGMLFGVVLLMIGVYRGMVVEAEVLLNDMAVDMWVVQENTLGPFAESSRIHEDLKDTIRVIDGVDKTTAITFQNIQLPLRHRQMRVLAVGFNPHGDINPINLDRLVAGRSINKSHYEMVIDDKSTLKLGAKVQLGKNLYTVVGVTHGAVSSSGDPLAYISLKDAQELQFLYSNSRMRNDRDRGIVVGASHMVNTIVATVKDGYSVNKVVDSIRQYKYKSVYTNEEQKAILTKNLVERSSKQIGLFTTILIIVSTIIVGLIIYTMTLEKMKEIAIMKLIGIPNSIIIKMIIQQTVVLGVLAFIFGNIFANLVYSNFPKKVVLLTPDALSLFVVIVIASILASFVGVQKVISADPASAIGG